MADGSVSTGPSIPTIGTWGTLNYPTWTTGTPFVKMTAAGTFALDTTVYYPNSNPANFVSNTFVASNYVPYIGATGSINIGANDIFTLGGAKLWDDGTVEGTTFQFVGLLGSLQSAASSNEAWLLPNQSGTIALLSDITAATNLDAVLTNGNISQIDAKVGGIFLYNPNVPSGLGYVYITGDKNRFNFYNNANVNYANIQQDTLVLIDSVVPTRQFQIKKPATIAATRTATFQDADGTVAYLSDIPVVTNPTLDDVLFNGNVSQINAFVGDIGIYNNHAPSGNGYVFITGSKNVFHFYNNIGTEYAQILQDTLILKDFASSLIGMQIKKPASLTTNRVATFQNASGTVAYLSDIPSITPAGLTKTDDTNVTLTLGGTPATSLLQGVSLTLGWSGTLADSRITSAAIWNAKQDAITLTTTGTGAATFVANVLNIPTPSLTGFVPYTGATSTVDLNTRDLYTTGKIFVGTTVDPGAAIKFAVSNGNMVIDNNWNFAGKRADGLVLSICKINTSNQLEFNPLYGQAILAYVFGFNGTEQMRLTNSGLLGIGTPTPTQKCHVQGNLRVTGYILDSSNAPGTSGQILSSTGTGTSWVNGIYKYNFLGSLTLTGTLTTTNLLTITIPANSLSDYLDLRSLMVQQSGPALAGMQVRVWHNSVNDFNTATRIANYAFGAGGADLFAQMTRKFSIQGGTLFGFPSTPSNATGEGSNTNAALSIPFDPTVTNYLFVSVQLNNVTDTAILRNVNITN
jgi:hypothetical protein